MRIVPVNQSIEVTHNIASFDDAVRILKSKDKIIAGECACRKQAQTRHEGCGRNLDACFMFGTVGQYYIEHHMGRVISLDEAINILKKCREDGFVTQVATSLNPEGMCNCCKDCCGVLQAISRHPEPAGIVFSNHMVFASAKDCVGCGLCIQRCPMNALKLDETETISVLSKRCIGCGLCVTTCPTRALRLMDNPAKERCLPMIPT